MNIYKVSHNKMNGSHFSNTKKNDKISLEGKKIKEEYFKNIDVNNRKSVPIFSSIKNMNQNEHKVKTEQDIIDKNINQKKPINLNHQTNKIGEKNIHQKKDYEIMDNLFNDVEKFNAKNILKGDLADIYDEVIKDNMDFKENIFFVNLNHYENMIGNCDNNTISHTYKDLKKEELLKNKYLPAKDLYNKYSSKAKLIKEKNEF